jgi:phage gpG-like protein
MDISLSGAINALVRFPALQEEAIRQAAPAIEVAAVSGVRDGMNRSISPDGTPYLPLKQTRPQGGNKPLLNTGVLLASTSAEVAGDVLTLRANAPGARLHQYGGTVRPVRAKALTIPLTKEAVRVGSPRNFPRRLFPFRGFLAERTMGGGNRPKLTLHYQFRRFVNIPARPYLGISDTTAEDLAIIYAEKSHKVALAAMKRGIR